MFLELPTLHTTGGRGSTASGRHTYTSATIYPHFTFPTGTFWGKFST